MKSTLYALAAAFVIVGVGAVSNAQNNANDPAQDAAYHNAQQAALADRQASDGWQYMEGGLLWRRIGGDGSGEHPTARDSVRVHYEGTFIDGTKFDSSYDRGQPISFPLTGVIPAWTMAVPMMGVGDTIEIASPAALAYGPVGRGPIPGGATLLFKVELLGIAGR